MRTTQIIVRAAVVSAAAITLGCNSLDAPDQNAVSLEGLTSAPTAASVRGAVQDLLAGMRSDAGTVVSTFGQFGREGYDLDPGNLQLVPQYFVSLGDLAIWNNPYRTIKLADLVLDAVGGVSSFTPAEQEGIRGFAMTVKAMELLTVIRCVDESGAALDAATGPTAPLPPIVSKPEVYAYIRQLLDSAETHLNAAGATFAFSLGAGFAGFDTPATFVPFNRAIRARADIDIGDFDQALTDLQASFLDLTKPLSYGPYNTYSTVAGDVQNPLYEAQPRVWYAHPSLAANAQHKTDGTLDARFLAKVKEIPAITRAGITTQWTFQIYTSPSAPIPIIRNEELILLRAEANLGLSHPSVAIQDINFVRTNSGGLPAISDPYVAGPDQPATLLDELLYEKRYSLLWEVGTSWLDARHYGKLADLPHDLANFVVYPYTRISDLECQARNNAPAGCQNPPTY
jgi:hypothetical protein